MKSDLQKLKMLRAAHIPSYAMSTNFETQNLNDLKSRITSRAVRDATTPVNFYLHSMPEVPANRDSRIRVAIAVGLLAKALCLQEVPAVHITLAGLLREARLREMEREGISVNPALEKRGHGYIAIGDFLEHADVEQRYGHSAIYTIADYLLEHVAAGGGLILGCSNIPLLEAVQYGASFSAMLINGFESYRLT